MLWGYQKIVAFSVIFCVQKKIVYNLLYKVGFVSEPLYTIFSAFIFRFCKPSEIGAAVAFLASDDASYMTGETIVVAGGQNSRLWKNTTKHCQAS